MKKFAVFALTLATLSTVISAQTATKPAPTTGTQTPAPAASGSFTGKWAGTFKIQRPDGTEGDPKEAVFNLVQKGKELTGTGGPSDQQWPIAKGVVTAGTATFEMQQPQGPLFKFTLTIVKGHLQGDMAGESDGVVRAHAKVDATKVVEKAK